MALGAGLAGGYSGAVTAPVNTTSPLTSAATGPAAPAGTIAGNLSFGNSGAGGLFGGGMAGLASSYQSAYDAALQMNQQNYNNILSGYQQTAQQQQAAQAATQQGYGNLYGSVLGGIAGIGQSQSNAIQQAYAQQQGASMQSLINAGLGNATVQTSVNAGLTQQEQQAQTSLANQLAQTYAGYQSNLGLAGLAYQGQAAQNNTNLNLAQLGFMNSVQSQYPDAAAYAQIAQMYGQQGQFQQSYGLAQQQMAAQQKAAQSALSRAGSYGSYLPAVSDASTVMPTSMPSYGISTGGASTGYPTGLGYNPALAPAIGSTSAYSSPSTLDYSSQYYDASTDPSGYYANAGGWGGGGDFGSEDLTPADEFESF